MFSPVPDVVEGVCFLPSCRVRFFSIFSRYFEDIHPLMCKKFASLVFKQLSCFPNTSVRISPIKLKTDMLYHMNNFFGNTACQIYVTVLLIFLVIYSTIKSQIEKVNSMEKVCSWDESCLRFPETEFLSYSDNNTSYVTTETFLFIP